MAYIYNTNQKKIESNNLEIMKLIISCQPYIKLMMNILKLDYEMLTNDSFTESIYKNSTQFNCIMRDFLDGMGKIMTYYAKIFHTISVENRYDYSIYFNIYDKIKEKIFILNNDNKIKSKHIFINYTKSEITAAKSLLSLNKNNL